MCQFLRFDARARVLYSFRDMGENPTVVFYIATSSKKRIHRQCIRYIQRGTKMDLCMKSELRNWSGNAARSVARVCSNLLHTLKKEKREREKQATSSRHYMMPFSLRCPGPATLRDVCLCVCVSFAEPERRRFFFPLHQPKNFFVRDLKFDTQTYIHECACIIRRMIVARNRRGIASSSSGIHLSFSVWDF